MKNIGLPHWNMGIFTLLIIILVSLGSAFLVQSCSEEIGETVPFERELAREALKTDLIYSLPEIQRLIENKEDHQDQKAIEAQMKSSLAPALYSSKKVLATYGISNAFLKESFGSDDDPRILVAAMVLAETQSGVYNGNRASLVSAFLQTDPDKEDWFDCAIRAVGIDAVMEMLNGRITEAIAKKAIKKIATRSLGWVGAAIAAYEFAKCMGWV